MDISMEWEGFEEVRRALDAWEEETIEAITKAQDENGEHLLSASQGLAFHLTGDLAGSGTKEEVKVDQFNREISVDVGFHKEYAARRHEEPGYYDKTNIPGPITRSKPPVDGMLPGRKFLERPLKHFMKRYIENIVDAIRGVNGGGD